MNPVVITLDQVSKSYRLGVVGTGTLRDDLKRWWCQMRGLPDPLLRVDQDGATDTIWALRDVSFEVRQGEVLGIIGRNGAGKSTLLKILSRVTAPTAGQIRIKGRMASLLEVGTGFHPELTGRENVFLNGAIMGMTRDEVRRKFDEIVTFADIDQFIDTPVKRYSSGMYVRLAFAVAAHLEPEILVVDEVLAVGDFEFQNKCIGKMKDVAQHGRTVLFVSHNMAAVQHLCTRAVLLQGGQLADQGDVGRIISAYIGSSHETSHADTDLRQSQHRSSGTVPFFTRMQVLVNGRPSIRPKMGEGLDVRLHYEAPLPLNSLQVGIAINDQFGQRLVNFSPTHQRPDALREAGPQGVVTCHIPHLNLIAGTYYLTVIASDKTGDLDRIENAVSIEIVSSDVFGSGKAPTRQHGVIYLPADWSLANEKRTETGNRP